MDVSPSPMEWHSRGVAGTGEGEFNRPSDVVVAPNGDIFVADGHGFDSNARIVKFSRDGRFIKTWGRRGTAPGDAAGRPIRVSAQETPVRPPSGAGTTNWYPASYSSATGLLYVPATGQGFGAIRAIDPTTGDQAWESRLNGATFTSGVLTTASDLVFTGTFGGALVDRYFHALDARTGQMLWRTAMAGSVRGSPMTYSIGGKQYIAVAAGNTVSAFALRQ
jgi:alcohol dehydrogenase (cytochrome c)